MLSDNNVTIALVSLAGVIAAAAFTAWTAYRAKSGKIATTEATQLWAELNSYKDELKGELVAIKEELSLSKKDNADLREENAKWRQRFDDMSIDLAAVKEENGTLRGRVYDLEKAHG